MKKFKLDLNQLKIDSFETTTPQKGIGTIKGNLTNTESINCQSELGCNTSDRTCRQTCERTCVSCDISCGESCNITCVSCQVTCESTCDDITCVVFDCKTVLPQ